MAKRKKLEAPSAEDLTRIEEEFRSETSARPSLGPGPVSAPIAQVVADAAAQAPVMPAEIRAEQARLKTDSDALRAAQDQGRLILDLPTQDIDGDVMVRDRVSLGAAEMTELRLSIAANGLRLPIEVFELAEPGEDGQRYGLISGYRRLMAVRALHELTQQDQYITIRALVRPRQEATAAIASMVEENEIRASLSHFERGRIAVISAQNGAFVNVEEAVNQLYPSASKAKRSKVRSFALIFEELGDMLEFPEDMTERRGLKLAQALRQGAESALRMALAAAGARDAEGEWAAMQAVIDTLDAPESGKGRGGRPRSAAPPATGWQNADTLRLSSGITLRRMRDSQGFILRIEGKGMDSDLMDSLMEEIRVLLERP